MIIHSVRALILAGILLAGASLRAQLPFQFPTANHTLFEPGHELSFFAPTAPDKPWTSGAFGCVRDDGTRMHEGLDIRCLQRDRHDEPIDPVCATADGTVVYFSKRPGLSNYGNYVVIRHIVEGLEIYSLYGHLSEILPSLTIGEAVKAGQQIGIMGRTSSAEVITKDRAHVHFELNMFVNENFAAWFRKYDPGERNDHGIWNGRNLNGLDDRQILLAEHAEGKNFSLLTFLRSQNELCRVQVRATSFPYLKRYPQLILSNPKAAREGVAGYEIALNYNGVAFALMPRAESEMKSRAKFQILSVNEAEEKANPCRKLVVKRGSQWALGNYGIEELEMLTY
jgi:murein DD-endopeptidase MepM/ murein hydrolase activator NlpD